MTQITPPRRILVATDMSARCDRALARGALLAGAWQSELTVARAVHAAEVARRDRHLAAAPSWRRPEGWVATLERQLQADLAAEGIAGKARVVQGSAADPVLALAVEEEADLVVLGMARDDAMDRLQLGSTVDGLVRRSRVPVLNVRNRARSPYRHVVVATDFSACSLHALQLAAHWFGDARLTLFHAYLAPGADAGSALAASDSWRGVVAGQCEAHLAEAGLAAPVRAALTTVLEHGSPEGLLPDYVASQGVDLVVLGSHGRGGVARALLGSTAENLLHGLDGDTLVVRNG